jgi:hypothetical protein
MDFNGQKPIANLRRWRLAVGSESFVACHQL